MNMKLQFFLLYTTLCFISVLRCVGQSTYNPGSSQSDPYRSYEYGSKEWKDAQALSEGVYGLDITKSTEENKKKYSEAGYNMSYQYKDSTIIISILSVLLLIYLGFVFKDKFKEKVQDVKVDTSLKNSENPIEQLQSAQYYYDKKQYSKSLEIINKILAEAPNYLAARKLKLNTLMSLGSYFEYENNLSGIVERLDSGDYSIVENQKDNFSQAEQADIFLTFSKAKELKGEMQESRKLKDLSIQLS